MQFLNDGFIDYGRKVTQTYLVLCEKVIAALVKSWINFD